MRLNLGANDSKLPGFMSVDLVPPADFVCDLREPWSLWPDSSVDEVVAAHIIEHLPDRIHTMNELWRVLKPGAKVTIDVPSASHGAGFFQDPTHVSPWCMNSFCYFTDGAPDWKRFHKTYGIRARFKVIELSQSSYKHHYEEVFVVHAVLEAVK